MRSTSVPTKRRVVALLSAAGMVAVTAACGAGGDSQSFGETTGTGPYALPENFELVIPQQSLVGPDNPGQVPYDAMASTIEELSEGKMTVEWTYSAGLHPGNEAVSAVRDNIVPMSFVMPGIEPTGFNVMTWMGEGLSTEVPTARPVIGELTTFAGSIDHGLDDQAQRAEYEALGVEPLLPRVVVHSGYHLLCKEPVTSIDDTEGTLVRTAGPNWASEAEALGMEPVSIPPTEQYEALQRGVVDCVMGPLRDWFSLSVLEVATQLTMDDEAAFVGFPAGWIANPQWWEELPPGAQNIIWAGLHQWATEYAMNQPSLDMAGLRLIAEDDRYAIHPMEDDLRTALQDFQAGKRDELVATPPKGLSGEEADALLGELGDSFDKWLGVLEELQLTEKYPETWAEMAEFSQTTDRVVEDGYKERVWTDIFEPNMPNPDM